MMRKRTQILLVMSSIALMLTACSHSPKKAEITGKYGDQFEADRTGGEGPRQQAGLFRNLASDGEDPLTVMKKWVVTPDDKGVWITSLDQVEQYNLFESKSKDQPYSGSYWPDKIGGVASHYRNINELISLRMRTDRNYRKWKSRHDETVKNFDTLTEYDIAILSPAEKYDYLLGDRDFSFSTKVWDGINQKAESQNGKMAKWSGICNGWTASAVELPRPRGTVVATAPNGKKVTFYPDDLKALAANLWAHDFVGTNSKMDDGTPATVMYGQRCNEKKPRRVDGVVADLDVGKATTSPKECKDLNPAVWHMSIINRNGQQKQSFIIDKDYDWHVNNHAVYGYKFDYFNVETGSNSHSYKESLLPIRDLEKDPFASERSPFARYVVGVEMEIKFIDYIPGGDLGETWDDESRDRTDTMKILYDLELDGNYKPVGGNWRANKKQKRRFILGFQKPAYPDFMWYQRQWTYSLAESYTHPSLKKHDWSQPLPEIFKELAKKGSEVVWYNSLRERAEMHMVPVGEIKAGAKAASDEYDVLCTKYCAAAYPRDPSGQTYKPDAPEYNTAEATAARKAMAKVDAKFKHYSEELDKLKIPKTRPFVQPVGRIVYGLLEAAKVPNVVRFPRPQVKKDADKVRAEDLDAQQQQERDTGGR